MSSPWIITTNGLVKKFGGVIAIDHLSISIPRGKITCILGPNGSGKSTLFNVLTGLIPFDEGVVSINGKNCKMLQPYANRTRSVARTFQEVRLFNQMTALDNVLIALQERRFPHSLFQFTSADLRNRGESYLRLVELTEKSANLAGDLSFGQRKLLEVARVLAAGSEIVLFDEPFAGMSFARIETVKNLLSALRSQLKSIVLIEHNMDVIRSLADEVVVLHHGQLLARGTFDEISHNDAVLAAYLGR
jgi:ABC-type branched-subunit amino acid transport system ATPase component